MAKTIQDIEKRFSASLNEVDNETFPVRNWHLKISFLSFAKFAIFPFYKKSFFITLLMPLYSIVHSDLFIWTMLYALL